MITDAQRLTREFDENKGIVILTPIQVNREGNKRAKAAEEGAPRYDLNAIAQNSEYQWHLDLCLSVYSDEDMKIAHKCEIQVIKKRKGLQPHAAEMTIDVTSGAFTYGSTEKTVEDMGVTAADIGYREVTTEEIGI